MFDVEGVTADQFPWLNVDCFQGKTIVYQGGENYQVSGISIPFTLANQWPNASWTWPAGTAASCTATVSVLNHVEHKVVATVNFDVAA